MFCFCAWCLKTFAKFVKTDSPIPRGRKVLAFTHKKRQLLISETHHFLLILSCQGTLQIVQDRRTLQVQWRILHCTFHSKNRDLTKISLQYLKVWNKRKTGTSDIQQKDCSSPGSEKYSRIIYFWKDKVLSISIFNTCAIQVEKGGKEHLKTASNHYQAHCLLLTRLLSSPFFSIKWHEWAPTSVGTLWLFCFLPI